MKKIILLALVFSLSVVNTSNAQSKSDYKEKLQGTYDAMKTIVKSKDFKYIGEVVFENTKRERVNAEANTLMVNQAKSSGNLSGLDSKTKVELDGKISNYNVNFNDDSQTIHIEYGINKMKILIDIKANGNAFLTLEGGANNITQRGKLQTL